MPLNLEMAATTEMVEIALLHLPHAACLVPEKREEKTTEGGLDIVGGYQLIQKAVLTLLNKGIRVSVFIEPEFAQLDAAKALGTPVVELHTGTYCNLMGDHKRKALKKIKKAAAYAAELELECHAGHGLGFNTVVPIAEILEIIELNIGHFLIGEAIFNGLGNTVKRMRSLIDTARANASKDIPA